MDMKKTINMHTRFLCISCVVYPNVKVISTNINKDGRSTVGRLQYCYSFKLGTAAIAKTAFVVIRMLRLGNFKCSFQ